MTNLSDTARWVNILAEFCGPRDVPTLTGDELEKKYNINQADVMVLFGGSILCGGDVLAEAMRRHAAKKYMIVGGEGHTTETLRQKMHSEFPEIETNGQPEARIFASYLNFKYNLESDYLECNSTNCGNNITNMLDLLADNNVPFHSIILCQDATMQLRMDTGLRKYSKKDTVIINYAAYKAQVTTANGSLTYEKPILGIWDMERYISLLMGEIPRLSDDSEGYGPKGKNFIAHIEIPGKVRNAFISLKTDFSKLVRKAEP